MKQNTYWLLEGSKHCEHKHLSTGFSFGAALFGPFWAAWRGSMGLVVAFSAGTALLYLLPQLLASIFSPDLSRTVAKLAGGGYTGILCTFANRWYRKALESDGWKVIGLTLMKSPTPPDQYGEWVVREFFVVSWPIGELPVPVTLGSKAIAGYVIAQHERDTDSWQLISADRSWSSLEVLPADSSLQAKTLAKERQPDVNGRWQPSGRKTQE